MVLLPSVDEIWDLTLPENIQGDANDRFYALLAASLPEEYVGFIYKRPDLDRQFQEFLADAAGPPFPNVASVLGLLGQMAGDAQWEEGDRARIDTAKIDLFWKIIANEVPLDAGADQWPKNSLKLLQTHASRIFDDCHLYATKANCEKLRVFYDGSVSKDSTRKVFEDLRNRVSSDLHVQTLLLNITASDAGIEVLKRKIYGFLIKLGVLERCLWTGTRPSSVPSTILTAIPDPGVEFPSDVPESRSCIKSLCDALAMSQVGRFDDTIKSKIRHIPEEMTNMKTGFHFLRNWDGTLFGGLGQLSWSDLKHIPPEFMADIVWTPFMYALNPGGYQKRKGTWFITREAKAMQVWR